MATFTGLYFDGKSVSPLAAQVQFTPAALQITYQDPAQKVPTTVYWQVHRLPKETLSDSSKTLIRYGAFPGQTLEITQPEFLSAFERYYAPTTTVSPPSKNTNEPKNRGLGLVFGVLLTLVALVAAAYFWLLPLAADVVARRIPVAYEQKLGSVLTRQLLASAPIDSAKTASLNGFMRQLKLNQNNGLTLLVQHNSVPNAFALPGGTIVVHDAMLPLLKSPDELAALLGHEYGHIAQRHSLRTLFRSFSGYILLAALFSDVSALAAIVLENAQNLRSLAYSRQFEKEADSKALAIQRQNNLDQNGLIALLEHLQQQNPGGGHENEFLSSHPLLSSRLDYIREQIKQTPSQQIAPNDSATYYFGQLKRGVNK